MLLLKVKTWIVVNVAAEAKTDLVATEISMKNLVLESNFYKGESISIIIEVLST